MIDPRRLLAPTAVAFSYLVASLIAGVLRDPAHPGRPGRLSTVSNAIKAFLFIRDASPLILLTGAVLAVGLAVPIGLLRPPPPPEADGQVRTALLATPAGRRWRSWAWRIPLTVRGAHPADTRS